ncbi:FliM/FliN family flagellar motor switch protein [Sphingomonas sp. DT-207]|uniref:FliM/FliN family flagellar motor switch protein n=1 Tax=Sphingomonas sp. DT-207 TaxID=3396167 RepID=UPI003F1DD707
MATALRLDALSSLPRVEAEVAALAEALIALMEADGIDATIVQSAPAGPWFICSGGVRFRVAGGPPLSPERVGDAITLLDRADPLLARVEAALGIALEPGAVGNGGSPSCIVLSLTADAIAATIAFPTDHPERAAWETRAHALQPADARLPVVLRVLAAGPRLGVAEAGALAAGDLVLIGAQPTAVLEGSDGSALTGQLDLATGGFTLHPEGDPMASEPAASAAQRDFAVPLTVRLPDRATSAASLATLRPGTALPLGPLTDGMPVELLVAGRLLARGELVQLGDRFAVLIEERAQIDDADATEPVEVDPDAAEAHA